MAKLFMDALVILMVISLVKELCLIFLIRCTEIGNMGQYMEIIISMALFIWIDEILVFLQGMHHEYIFRNTRKMSSPFTYVPARCRGEPYVRPRTNNAFVPMYDGRTQGSPLHVFGT